MAQATDQGLFNMYINKRKLRQIKKKPNLKSIFKRINLLSLFDSRIQGKRIERNFRWFLLFFLLCKFIKSTEKVRIVSNKADSSSLFSLILNGRLEIWI